MMLIQKQIQYRVVIGFSIINEFIFSHDLRCIDAFMAVLVQQDITFDT